MGHLESQLGASARSAAGIPAAIFRESISARRATAGAAKPELPLPAARNRSPAAISDAASAKCPCAFSAAKGASGAAASAKCPRAFFPAKVGSDSGTIFRAAGLTRSQSDIFASASRTTGTIAANGRRRRSEAGRRPHASSAERPERPAAEIPAATSGGPARAAGNEIARPGQRTARQGTSAGAWPGQGARERRAAGRGTQQMRLPASSRDSR
jgi:hypothetical protein